MILLIIPWMKYPQTKIINSVMNRKHTKILNLRSMIMIYIRLTIRDFITRKKI